MGGTAVLGGGPAGLTAAYLLALRGEEGALFEADGRVGGLAKTVELGPYRFDLGGHRFFTKLAPIQELWERVLGDDFLVRPRLSRIYYDGRYFGYPLRAKDVPTRLGVVEAIRCALSYLAAQARRGPAAETFEDWVEARFGRRLYDSFFRSYTEKVWGIPGSEIRSEWAVQRIRDFSLARAVWSMLGVGRSQPTTLIERFHYPRLGPGQMWERLAELTEDAGVGVHLNRRCVSIRHRGARVESVVLGHNGSVDELAVDRLLSTIPLRELIRALEPAAPPAVRDAAERLRYRDMCVVALMTHEEEPFPDNWIYLHDRGVRAGRVQNFGAWSPAMVEPGTSCLGVEYFCFEGDELWTLDEDAAVELATRELASVGLLDPDHVFDGVKVRVPKAYPMYDLHYRESLAVIRDYLAGFANLQTCGRNGLHRYNNQDHSMWTAILAVLNLLDGAAHDVWSVNTEAVYLEEGRIVEAELERALLPA